MCLIWVLICCESDKADFLMHFLNVFFPKGVCKVYNLDEVSYNNAFLALVKNL